MGKTESRQGKQTREIEGHKRAMERPSEVERAMER
jgi:hypothetical protein